jgi:hypothetical protein
LEFHVSEVGGVAGIFDFFLSSNAAATGSGSVADTLEVCLAQTAKIGANRHLISVESGR